MLRPSTLITDSLWILGPDELRQTPEGDTEEAVDMSSAVMQYGFSLQWIACPSIVVRAPHVTTSSGPEFNSCYNDQYFTEGRGEDVFGSILGPRSKRRHDVIRDPFVLVFLFVIFV